MIEPGKLRDVSILSRLSDRTLAKIAAELAVREFEAGTVLFHKGDPGDELFIVDEGAIAIFEPSAANPGQEKPIRIFRPGEVLGEMALIDAQPRTLSARALGRTRTLVLGREDFRRFLDDRDLALAVMASLNDRIRYTTEFLSEVQHWVGRVARGQYASPEFLEEVRGWVQQVANGEASVTLGAQVQHRDPVIAGLAADFAQMATQVRQREDELRQEIARLQIEIDETKKERQVAEITESDYFRELQARAKELRRKRR